MRKLLPVSALPVPARIVRLGTAGAAVLLLAGCASYGSFDENEPGLERSVLGGLIDPLGMAPEEEPIEYSARAPLVAPPSASQLPQPRTEPVAATNPNWPTGSRQRMAQVLGSEDQTLVYTPGVDGVDIAATQALAERSRSGPQQSNAGVDRPLTPQEMQREADIQLARAEASAARTAPGGTPRRRFLTDPPVESRSPSPEAPYGVEAEVQEEESGWSWWPF